MKKFNYYKIKIFKPKLSMYSLGIHPLSLPIYLLQQLHHHLTAINTKFLRTKMVLEVTHDLR